MVLSRFSRVLPIALFLAWIPATALAAAPSVQDARYAYQQGNNSAALEKVNAFLAANPKDAQGRFLKGLILTELNRHGEAIKVFSALTDDYPELPQPYNNLAVLYADQGEYEQAKNSLEMAIRTDPAYATAHENLGDIYAKMASQSYDKALQMDKSNTSAKTKLALIRELFSPMHMQEAGKGNSSTKPGTAKANHLAQQATPPPLASTRPILTQARGKVQDSAKPAEPAADGSETSKPAEPPMSGEIPSEKPQEKPASKAAASLPPKVAIERTLHAWAEAWSKRDADAYLAFYGKDFKVPDGRDRAEWERDRKGRVTRPEFIKVALDKIKIKLKSDQAEVHFTQHYASNIVKDKGKKTLILEKQDDAWKIVEER